MKKLLHTAKSARPITALVLGLLLSCQVGAQSSSITPAANEVIYLFDGQNLSNWDVDVPSADNNPDAEPSFIIRDGLLVSLGDPRGHLITKANYSNYELDVEYRFASDPGNAGVLIHSSTPRALYDMFPQSIEVQMQHGDAGDFWCIEENIKVADMAIRRPKQADQEWGGSRGDARRILNLSDDSENPLGEWNHMRIRAQGDRVLVWVNGDLVNNGFSASVRSGKIAIQAEGSEVEFRRLELTSL